MKTSIIDVGTKSIKHLIFEGKKQILFDKDSTIKLGEKLLKVDNLDEGKINRAICHIKNLLQINKDQDISKTIVIATNVLRKAANAKDFIDKLKKETNLDIKIISHEDEAKFLGKAFQGFINEDFAAVDIGGGSTEVVVFKNNAMHLIPIPFGVNKIYQEFLAEDYANDDFNNQESWQRANVFIQGEIEKAFSKYPDLQVNNFFIDGTQTFMLKQDNLLQTNFEKSMISQHPAKMTMQTYVAHIKRLKEIGVKRLAENFHEDPGYCDNFAIGQSVYFAIAKQLKAKTIYPSDIQYTHGLIE